MTKRNRFPQGTLRLSLVVLAGMATAWLLSYRARVAARTAPTSTVNWLHFDPYPDVNIDVGPDGVATQAFTIQNRSSEPIELLGSRQSCSCMASEGLPATLGPGQEARVMFRIASAGIEPGVDVTRTSKLFTDHKGLSPQIVFHVKVKVSSPAVGERAVSTP